VIIYSFELERLKQSLKEGLSGPCVGLGGKGVRHSARHRHGLSSPLHGGSVNGGKATGSGDSGLSTCQRPEKIVVAMGKTTIGHTGGQGLMDRKMRRKGAGVVGLKKSGIVRKRRHWNLGLAVGLHFIFRPEIKCLVFFTHLGLLWEPPLLPIPLPFQPRLYH